LAQAAAVVAARRWTYPEYLRALRDQPVGRVLPADRGDAYPRGTAEAILLSLQVVTGGGADVAAARVLDTVALLSPDGVSAQLLRELLVGEVDEVDQAVETLVAASLLSWVGTGAAVAIHRLVARVIRDRHRAAGTLGQRLTATVEALAAPARQQHWNSDLQSRRLELTAHCLAVWDVAKTLPRAAGNVAEITGAANLANWAIWHLTQSADLTRAVAVGQTLIADSQRVLGADHPETLASRNDLACAYESAGQLDRAVPLFEVTLADRVRVLPLDHPLTSTVRGNFRRARG
jgi:hypothetical protein